MPTHTFHKFAAASIIGALCAIPLTAQTSQDQSFENETVKLEKFEVKEMKEFSDQAVVGKTPVSVVEIPKNKIVDELASRDIPFALEQAPSFFVTNQGGGAGDSRISLRGFNQRNISILINGVPTNDNENGWLYWSNWDGLGDATAVIQLQKGLSYSTLPTPSIGGTMNVITDPAAAELGASVKVEFGSDGFQKQSYTVNTGLLKDRLAVTFSATHKSGSGFTNGVWTEARGFYLGASLKLNDRNKLEFYAIASPQLHGQNTYQQSIATYDANYARSLGFTDAQIAKFPEQGRRYNQRWNVVSPNYTGAQYFYGKTHDRHASDYLNEVVNYYNKPQINLNWFSTLTETLKLNTVVYYSGGEGGGGTLPVSTLKVTATATSPNPSPTDWNKTIAANVASATGSKVVIGNNTNYQDTYGAITKLAYEQGPWKFSTGLDARMAKIDHWVEVRDLLGGTYYTPATATLWKRYASTGLVTSPLPKLGLGDKFNYYYTNDIKWLGAFAQTQYEKGPITAFATYGYSVADYKYTNHFVVNDDGSDRVLKSKQYDGHQVKTGLQYAFNKHFAVYGNVGYVSKLPIHGSAINYNGPGRLLPDVPNETFKTAEVGVRSNFLDKKLTLSSSFYYTEWRNRTATSVTDNYTKFVNSTQPATALFYQTGLNSNYSGLETELAYRPCAFIRFDASFSVNNWYFTGDGHKDTYNQTTGLLDSSAPISLKSVKVGDAPQSQFNLGTTVFPVKGLSISANARNAQRYYANYTPENRTNDYGQSWRVPNFTVADLHVNYRIQVSKRVETKLFFHLLNVFDKTYIQDATDNYFSATQAPGAANHTAARSEVYMGTPRTYSMGVKISF